MKRNLDVGLTRRPFSATLLLGPDIRFAMEQIGSYAWGYPRKLTPDDANAVWVMPAPNAYFWIERVGDDGVLHVALAPELRHKLYPRSFLVAIRRTALALRLTHLHVVGGNAFTLPAEVCDYLERLGGIRHEKGYTWEVQPTP